MKRALNLPVTLSCAVLLLSAAATVQSAAQVAPGPLVVAQQDAQSKFADLAGEWCGEGWSLSGKERVPLDVTLCAGFVLDGSTLILENRSYRRDGSVASHSFNNIGFDNDQAALVMQARAEGRFRDFALIARDHGYVWHIGSENAGLGYTGVIRDGTWTEVTDVLSPGE